MKSGATKPTLRLATTNQNNAGEKTRKRISRSRLINLLNRINFSNGTINAQFKHRKYNHSIIVQAQPQICNDDFLRCLWSKHFDAETRLKHFRFQFFTFTDGLNQVKVIAELLEINNNGIYLELPDHAYDTFRREVKRYDCHGISAQVSQDGWVVNGNLVNFTSQSLVVQFRHESSLLKNEIDLEQHVHLVLKKDGEFFFSGSCSILRQKNSKDQKILVLKPSAERVHRIKSKEFRNDRLVLSPLPSINFQHPLIQKKFHLGLIDISGLGFSVEEDVNSSVLLPGMMIPEMEIQFMHGFSIRCKAQVLYRIPRGDTVKCGIVILDMNMPDHLKLSSLIHQAKNKHSYISTTNIDINALWDFFFETGFIYPDKYQHIVEQKEEFITFYKKLYQESPEIARHVIYQDKGKIYGHVSMFRFYQKTWLMQHHAAIRSRKHKAGLVVMDHILQYINELHSLPSAKMNYIGCYYRPNNRFANRVFGASSKALNNLKKSSLDEFAYFHFQPKDSAKTPSTSWQICESDRDDIEILNQWYSNISGGLLLKALDLTPETFCMDEVITDEYRKTGFKRDQKIFSLKKDDELLALLVVNISDFGLNMSDLTNCIQIFVMDQKLLHEEIINYTLAQMTKYYENATVPVLIYPKSYADNHSLPYSKTYTLGLLNVDHMSEYLQFIDSLTRPKKSRKIQELTADSR